MEAILAVVEELRGKGWVGDSRPDTIFTHSQTQSPGRLSRGLLSLLTETIGP